MLQQWKTCIIKSFSIVPKRPISFSMCIKKSCLSHTAAKDRALDYFGEGGIYVLFSPFAARGWWGSSIKSSTKKDFYYQMFIYCPWASKFNRACVSKIAVYHTRQLRIEHQSIFLGGLMFFLHHFPHTAAKAQALDFFTCVLFTLENDRLAFKQTFS